MYDIKIVNGSVVDFEYLSLKSCNLGIINGKIVEIGDCFCEAKTIIDASNCIVSPGFVDSHMHEETIEENQKVPEFDISNHMVRMGVTTCVGGNCGFNFSGLEGLRKFINFVDKDGAPVNYVLFAGYTTLREECGVTDRYSTSTDCEQEQIFKHFSKYSDLGVAGVSFGLEYTPGITTKEMMSFTNRISNESFLLSAHFREDGKNAAKSMEELVQVSKESNLPMRVSHIGSCAAVGFMTDALEVIEKARDEKVKIDADCYPYEAFSTFIGSAIFDDGWREKLNTDYHNITLLESPYKNRICDKDLFEHVRTNYPKMMVSASVMIEEEIVEAMTRDYMSIASDGILNKGQGHPRAAGTFPRVLGRYVRDQGSLELIDALKKMTVKPARWLGLNTKGELKVGYDADIVVFNASEIKDHATYSQPTLKPEGIKYVIINGQIAVKDKDIISNRLGMYLRRGEL